MRRILVVDDETAQRGIMSSILKSEGYRVFEADSVESALSRLEEEKPEVILTDLKMPGKSGIELVEQVTGRPQQPEIIVITAFGTIETAVKAMRLGAYDYLTKPLEREELILSVSRALEKYDLRQNSFELRRELTRSLYDGLVAESKAMRDILEVVRRVAGTDATVLIQGGTGTGKERIAKLIHYQSPRGSRPLQSINCAAFPETLLESELFGYEKGSFTGAQSRKIGLFEAASGSTLFLDEVGDMSLNTQAKVLRAIQEKEIRRVGGTAPISVDIRIIAATNQNLEENIRKGSFREDLYYRLKVIPVFIPPLSERKEDIRALAAFFLSRRGRSKKLSPAALSALEGYGWPGNVRELEAVIERVAILSPSDEIAEEDLPVEIRQGRTSEAGTGFRLPENGFVFEEFEKNLMNQVLTQSGGVLADAARRLGMTYRTFQYRAGKFGLIERKDEPEEPV
jgi:DNA-binding NtrC family response regulator